MGQPRHLFVYFHSFQTQFYRLTVGFSGIRTRIVRVEGEHADHITITAAQCYCSHYLSRYVEEETKTIKAKMIL